MSKGVFDFHDGLSAVILESGPGELAAPASDAHIVSMFVKTEARHRLWRDGRQVTDGPVPERAINLIPAGVKPRAVVSQRVQALQIFIPHATVIRRTEQAYSARVAADLALIDPRFARDEAFEGLASALFDSVAAGAERDSLWLDSLGAAIVARVIERWSNASELARAYAGKHSGGLAPHQVRDLKQYLHDNIAEKLTLQDMADRLGLSVFHFARSFKTTVGLPPYTYLAKLRLDHARMLMHRGRRSVPEIASQVGHDDVVHFARAFRKEFGLTPIQYMRTLG